MSTRETETVKACPHGHISIRKRTQVGEETGLNGRTAKTRYYCNSCANIYSGNGRVNPHYERQDLIEKERRVNPQLDYDVKLGYVWSPSHDD